MAAIPHWSGRNQRTLWVLDNDKQLIDIMSTDINAVGTKVADGIAGENRTRNQFILDHYEVKFEVQMQKLEALRAVLRWQTNIDGFAIPLGSTVGLVITFNDGAKDTVVLQDITIDDWSFAIAGRSDRNKFTLPMRANVCKIL
jgi:hypothetical protein